MEKRAIPRFIPALLNVGRIARVQAFESIANVASDGLPDSKQIVSEVRDSLYEYVRLLVLSGKFSSLVENYLPKSSTLDVANFSLLLHKGSGRPNSKPFNTFFYDGFVSLLMFYGNPNDGVGVTVGLDLLGNGQYQDELDTNRFASDDLIVNQIQGARIPGTAVQETFSGFRWEHLLVGQLMEWARSSGKSRLLLLPAKHNKWSRVNENANGTAKMRYDVTAKRLGFKRNSDEEPFSLDLRESWKDFYQVFVTNN